MLSEARVAMLSDLSVSASPKKPVGKKKEKGKKRRKPLTFTSAIPLFLLNF